MSEREELAQIIYHEIQKARSVAEYRAADAILAAGWHRSSAPVVSQPDRRALLGVAVSLLRSIARGARRGYPVPTDDEEGWLSDDFDRLADQLNALADAPADAAEDTQRLDWLEAHAASAVPEVPYPLTKPVEACIRVWKIITADVAEQRFSQWAGRAPTLRMAVDMARNVPRAARHAQEGT
jgi:hypothetical protein